MTPAAYITSDDVLKAVPSTLFANIDPEVVQLRVDDANALAEAYLGVRYKLPLSSTGADLRRQLISIAVYDLMSYKGFNPENSRDMNFRMRYDDAIKWLTGVANGNVTPVGVVDSSGGAVTQAAPVIVSDPPRGW